LLRVSRAASLTPNRAPRAQSPIDIVVPTRSASPDAMVLTFAPTSLRIVHHEHIADAVNNGHTPSR